MFEGERLVVDEGAQPCARPKPWDDVACPASTEIHFDELSGLPAAVLLDVVDEQAHRVEVVERRQYGTLHECQCGDKVFVLVRFGRGSADLLRGTDVGTEGCGIGLDGIGGST